MPVTYVGIDSGGTRTSVRIIGESEAPLTIQVDGSLSGALEPQHFGPCLNNIFAALAAIPAGIVALSFFAGTLALFALTLELLLRRYPDKRDPLFILAVCSMAGVWHTLGYLQLYAPLILAVAAAWLLMRRGNLLLAGIAIGLMVAIKPNFALWPVLMLAAGHPRVGLSALQHLQTHHDEE